MRSRSALRRLLLGAGVLFCACIMSSGRDFPVWKVSAVWYDSADTPLAATVADMLAGDIEMVTGHRPEILSGRQRRPCMIVLGTEGNCSLSSSVPGLNGRWESYSCASDGKILRIIGSDPRGMAFGAMEISSRMGVSPWYWWADVPVARNRRVSVEVPEGISREPSVKYRGIFINDEDFGLQPWASKVFEPENGTIGPKTYARVCELLLRLKANTLMPAMHSCTKPFYSIPENKEVAAKYGIVVTTSHCEPLLFNNESEWDRSQDWNYITNKAGIDAVLESRVREAAPYENIWQLGMRGIHDREIVGAKGLREKAKVMNEAIRAQREILSRVLGRPITDIPQSFTPYKEVMDIMASGLLELPEDVTIVWPDDNYGYMKRLSGSMEQGRSGRSGVYYHVSYLGPPHVYLWFSTTPTALMYEELAKAYRTGADRYWVFNVGDIKACEMQMSFGLSLAYDFDAFDADSAAAFPVDWYVSIFGEDLRGVLSEIVATQMRLSFVRKPEYMVWGSRDDMMRRSSRRDMISDTEFSFVNYNEAENRLVEYSKISALARSGGAMLPAELQPAWFELIEYQIAGSELLNRIGLKGQQYREYVEQRRASAVAVRTEVTEGYEAFEALHHRYWDLLDGKWRYVIGSLRERDAQHNPKVASEGYLLRRTMPKRPVLSKTPVLGIQAEGDAGLSAWHELEPFNIRERGTHWIEIYNTGTGVLEWTAKPSEAWVKLSSVQGKTQTQDRITVDIDWDAVPEGEVVPASISISSGGKTETVLVSADSRTSPCRYSEGNGWLRIPAADFDRKAGSQADALKVVEGIGSTGSVLQLGEIPFQHFEDFRDKEATRAEYDFYCYSRGWVDVYAAALPTFLPDTDREYTMPCVSQVGARYSIAIDEPCYVDGQRYAEASSSVPEFSSQWKRAVLCNMNVMPLRIYIDKPGKHTLLVRMGDPGVLLDHITLDFGGLKNVYVK